jgi:hypothetical protein
MSTSRQTAMRITEANTRKVTQKRSEPRAPNVDSLRRINTANACKCQHRGRKGCQTNCCFLKGLAGIHGPRGVTFT